MYKNLTNIEENEGLTIKIMYNFNVEVIDVDNIEGLDNSDIQIGKGLISIKIKNMNNVKANNVKAGLMKLNKKVRYWSKDVVGQALKGHNVYINYEKGNKALDN